MSLLSDRPLRYIGAVADPDFTAMIAGRRFIRQRWWRFGQSYRLSITAGRTLLVAEALLAPPAIMLGREFHLAQLLACAWAVFTVFEISLPRLAWRQDITKQPVFALLDWGAVGALLIAHTTLSPTVLIFVCLLIADNRLSRIVKAAAIVATLILTAVMGASIGIVGSTNLGPGIPALPAIVFVASLALANWLGHQAWRTRFRKWKDHLTIAAVTAGENVGDATMNCLRAAYGTENVFWLGQHSAAQSSQFTDQASASPLPPDMPSESGPKTLATELAGTTAFAYEHGNPSIVGMSARHSVGIIHAPILDEAIAADGLAQSYLTGGVIRLEHGLIVFLVPSKRAPSKVLLEETLDRTLGVITAFDRFTQQEIWEAQNFLAARKAVSRDLHDTVLQTLASLRMRISSLLAKATNPGNAAIRQGLEDLQAIVSDEQRTLREVIEGAKRDATLDRDLNEVISETTKTVSAQWGVKCTFAPLVPPVMVDEQTSSQCNQIIREVVSNAVRHGRASRFSVGVSMDTETLMIAVRDDSANSGSGLPFEPEISSKSVSERLEYVGGSAYVDRAESGSIFSIRIPVAGGQHG